MLFRLFIFLAFLLAIFACQQSADILEGCQVTPLEGASREAVEAAMLYNNINFSDDNPIILSELQDIPILDGEMSSLKIPPGYEVVLFSGEYFEKPYVTLTGDIPNLNKYLFNDRARSMKFMKKVGEKTNTLPQIFYGPNFTGESIYLPYGLSEPTPNDNLLLFSGGSIKVPTGFRVRISTNKKARLMYSVENVYKKDTTSMPHVGDTIASVVVEMDI